MLNMNEIEWLEPWSPIGETGVTFYKELIHEINLNHPLYSICVRAIARREDCDDVLFELANSENKLAVVHLTWSKTKDFSGKYPKFKLYKDIADWIQNCMRVNNEEFML